MISGLFDLTANQYAEPTQYRLNFDALFRLTCSRGAGIYNLSEVTDLRGFLYIPRKEDPE
jgi:hypothetical protein